MFFLPGSDKDECKTFPLLWFVLFPDVPIDDDSLLLVDENDIRELSSIKNKKPYPKEYQIHSNPAIILSIGRNGGIGQLPNKGGTVIGSLIIKYLKSKHMFTSRQRSRLNYKSDDQLENKSAYSSKLYSVQSILSLTEEDARNLLAGLPMKELEPGQDFI